LVNRGTIWISPLVLVDVDSSIAELTAKKELELDEAYASAVTADGGGVAALLESVVEGGDQEADVVAESEKATAAARVLAFQPLLRSELT
jgi:uncharacterized protein involved in outer membrane biogenesis